MVLVGAIFHVPLVPMSISLDFCWIWLLIEVHLVRHRHLLDNVVAHSSERLRFEMVKGSGFGRTDPFFVGSFGDVLGGVYVGRVLD